MKVSILLLMFSFHTFGMGDPGFIPANPVDEMIETTRVLNQVGQDEDRQQQEKEMDEVKEDDHTDEEERANEEGL